MLSFNHWNCDNKQSLSQENNIKSFIQKSVGLQGEEDKLTVISEEVLDLDDFRFERIFCFFADASSMAASVTLSNNRKPYHELIQISTI